jgi:hypothetical protein
MNFDRRLGAQHPNAGRNTQQSNKFEKRKKGEKEKFSSKT